MADSCSDDVAREQLRQWAAEARRQLRAGTLTEEHLDRLEVLLRPAPAPRQRLLYLHTRDPSPSSAVVAWAFHPGTDTGGAEEHPPYETVVDALADGWRAVHFPQQLAPFDDRETDILGFEFILEKLEAGR